MKISRHNVIPNYVSYTNNKSISIAKDFVKQRYNTPYLHKVINNDPLPLLAVV